MPHSDKTKFAIRALSPEEEEEEKRDSFFLFLWNERLIEKE